MADQDAFNGSSQSRTLRGQRFVPPRAQLQDEVGGEEGMAIGGDGVSAKDSIHTSLNM